MLLFVEATHEAKWYTFCRFREIPFVDFLAAWNEYPV